MGWGYEQSFEVVAAKGNWIPKNSIGLSIPEVYTKTLKWIAEKDIGHEALHHKVYGGSGGRKQGN